MKILFQGDSITDACRTCCEEDPDISLGKGFPKVIARQLPEIYPDIKFEFINRGVGGHRTIDLINRWQTDTIDFKPDIMTLLIGVNDCWHYAEATAPYVTAEEFEANFRKLITDTKEKTSAKVIIIEPYVFEFTRLNFRADLLDKIEIERRVSRELADYYIPLDGLFNAARTANKNIAFTEDGVHPTEEGHELIATYVMDAICDIIDTQNETEE